MSILERPDVSAFAARGDGLIVTADDPGWDEARRAWNLAVDQRPAAVALPRTADDVAAIVALAREHGLRVLAQATGHNAAAVASLADTVLIKTERMRGVQVDPQSARARVEAGAWWADLAAAATPFGLVGLAGSSPDVGVVGYCLGGGIGWLAREFGLAANSVLAVELVTGDGRRLTATADQEPELFWALRGGGGSFGIVTALELALFPLSEVYAGALFFPWERAGEVLHTWRRWAEDVPDSLTSVGRLLQVPPLPDVPVFLQGRQFVVVEVSFNGDAQRGAELIEPLRALGAEIDTVDLIAASGLAHLHMDPEQPVPGIGAGRPLAALPEEALDALIEVAGPDSGTSLLSTEIRHLGGACSQASETAGVLARMPGPWQLHSVGIPMDAQVGAAIVRDLQRLREALAPWDAGLGYANFVEQPVAASALFAADDLVRLAAVKRAYDPDGVIRAAHQVEAGSGAAG